jgi:hypothetical protein
MTALQTIGGSYCLLVGSVSASDCRLAEQFRSLREVQLGQGYYVKITNTAGATLTVEGETTVTQPIALKPGANWVGYLPTGRMAVSVALQSIAGKVLRVYGLNETYIPGLESVSTLQEMMPGQGYAIYVTQAVTLTYPAGIGNRWQGPVRVDAQREEACEGVEPTPHFTVVYGRALWNGKAMRPGTKVQAIAPDGSVAGCSVVREDGALAAMQVFGMDSATIGGGYRGGERVRLRFGSYGVVETEVRWSADAEVHAVKATASGTVLYLPYVAAGDVVLLRRR